MFLVAEFLGVLELEWLLLGFRGAQPCGAALPFLGGADGGAIGHGGTVSQHLCRESLGRH